VKGYLTRNPSDHRYRLTREVRLLGDNFTDSLWVAEIGAPEVGALFREVGWPTNLATFDGRQMLVRESTHRFCSFMTHRTMVGARIHMGTSLGLAFASHTTASAKPAFVKLVALDLGVTQKEARSRLAAIRQSGYAIASEALEKDILAIATPILHNGVAVAAINVVVPAQLVSPTSLKTSIMEALISARRRLERGLAVIDIVDAT
jgi:IclR family mhp operon transcriptional activator